MPQTLWVTVQGDLKTGAKMTVEPLLNPLSNPCRTPCRTLCVAPPYTPGRLHSLPASVAGGCLLGVDGLRSWLNKKWTTARPATARRIGDKGTRRDPPHLHL